MHAETRRRRHDVGAIIAAACFIVAVSIGVTDPFGRSTSDRTGLVILLVGLVVLTVLTHED